MVTTQVNRQEFFAINGLRFIAATWVLLFHTSIHFGRPENLNWIQPILDQGVLAMTMFFMMSGFILTYRYSSFTKNEDIHNYIAARIARLYPVYIFMGITTLWRLGDGAGQFLLIDKFGYLGAIPFAIFAVFLFVFAAQAWFPSLFGIWNFGGSWSLSVEAFFYSLFPRLRTSIGALGDRTLTILTLIIPFLILVVSVGLIISYTEKQDTSKIFYVLPIFRLPEFVLGVCGYILFVERGLHRRILSNTGAVFGVILAICIYWKDLPGLLDWGFPASIFFMACFVFCLKINASGSIKKIVNYLGKISYCVYMAQFTTIPVLKKMNVEFTLAQEWILAIFATFLLAIFTYHLIEVIAYARTKTVSIKTSNYLWSLLKGVKNKETGASPVATSRATK